MVLHHTWKVKWFNNSIEMIILKIFFLIFLDFFYARVRKGVREVETK